MIVLRFGDLLEVTGGECVWCPVWESHLHLITSDEPLEIDREFIPIAGVGDA